MKKLFYAFIFLFLVYLGNCASNTQVTLNHSNLEIPNTVEITPKLISAKLTADLNTANNIAIKEMNDDNVTINIKSQISDSEQLETIDYKTIDMLKVKPTADVNACDISGTRQPDMIVDIGYDSESINRNYYSHTNSNSQVDWVFAQEIILQDEKVEQNKSGRYCNDEAKVAGVESEILDEGHIIADSLGGVSNAYNITPEDSTLNREGQQRQMEQSISDLVDSGTKVTDFYAVINYEDSQTMIPSNYYFQFKANGKTKEFYFTNGSNIERIKLWLSKKISKL